MFSFFKKKKPELTFKSNVEEFWSWFSKNAARLKKTIDDGNCGDLVDETNEVIRKAIPQIGWCYGPGESEGRHSLTLSPAGDRDHQFLAEYWLSRKPEISHWDFYSAKQGDRNNDSCVIETGGFEFALKEIWVSAELDFERKEIDLTAWHHHFYEIDEDERYRVTFLWLDEMLGEYDVQNYIYLKEFSTEKLADSIPLNELPEYLDKIKIEHEWDKPSPCKSYYSYRLKEAQAEFPRSDAFVGSTCHFSLVKDYFRAQGDLENPLKDSHAEYVFIRFSNEILPDGNEVDFRSNIEDKIDDALKRENSGQSFGGSQGSTYAYIDFLLYDGQNSVDLVLQEMKTAGLPGGTTLHYWANHKKEVYTL